MKKYSGVTKQALARMPYYLENLKKLHNEGIEFVSAPQLAKNTGVSDIQVRKDLASVSSERGKPKAGFNVENLIMNIEELLGYNNLTEAVLVGVGNLGKALLGYGGFKKEGLKIVAAFDSNPLKYDGKKFNNIKIYEPSLITEITRENNIRLGIICTQGHSAQRVCDALVAGGVISVLNFTSLNLSVPEGVLVDNINITSSLAFLLGHLRDTQQQI